MVLSEYRLHDEERLVCPRCGKKSIVLHGDSTYVCLDHHCGFRNDVSEGGVGGAGEVLAGFLGVTFLLVLLQSFSPSQTQGSNSANPSLFYDLQPSQMEY